MNQTNGHPTSAEITSFEDFAQRVDYSLMSSLSADPQATEDGRDHQPRQVRSGHYVPVRPTPIPEPEYIAHSDSLFSELGLSGALARDERFLSVFTGDLSVAEEPMRQYGWATGYALSIYGTEYTDQCPFRTGNGYGDGRAISVFEGVFNGQRWEMQLKGGGPTPYCRGADGRAVLRSSVREFLAQDFMHALGVPTSRSLTLYTSRAETVRRPWYSPQSRSYNPDMMVDNFVAISTRVAPSFLRVGQLELFARRARSDAHPNALSELKLIVQHLIERQYREEVDPNLAFENQVVELARLFRGRLTSLVAQWLRVGYCQGNFNSDNCAAGGFTLDYGPFGFCEMFNPKFQPWTGGGHHFSLFNQPAAAETNFHMFWTTLQPLLADHPDELAQLDELREGFAEEMGRALRDMWAQKLGLPEASTELVTELLGLMVSSKADYTIFFRELSRVPDDVTPLKRSFYMPSSEELDERWRAWLESWRELINERGDVEEVSSEMKRVNPSVAWREWLIAPAYQRAEQGDYSLVHELQEAFRDPYSDLPTELAAKYDRLKPRELFNTGGISHYSCSS